MTEPAVGSEKSWFLTEHGDSQQRSTSQQPPTALLSQAQLHLWVRPAAAAAASGPRQHQESSWSGSPHSCRSELTEERWRGADWDRGGGTD